jgi:addiction module RelE/StbE family toxin
MKLVFTPQANQDFLEIVRFISKDKPGAAQSRVRALRKSIEKLSKSPHLGRIVPEHSDETIRELIKGQYRIVYKIDIQNKTIVVLTFSHSMRLLPYAHHLTSNSSNN